MPKFDGMTFAMLLTRCALVLSVGCEPITSEPSNSPDSGGGTTTDAGNDAGLSCDGSSAGCVIGDAPTITSITPNNGLPGTSVTLDGTNFRAGAIVTIGGIAATGVTVNSGTSITATVPTGLAPGSHDVVVTNTDTTSATSTGGFTINAAGSDPTVATLTPDGTLGGPWIATLPFTITGTNFQAGVTVTLGGVDCAVNTVTATQIDGFIPSGVASGYQPLVITNPDNSTVTYGSVFYP